MDTHNVTERRDVLLAHPQPILSRDIRAGDRVQVWHTVRAYDPDKHQWLPVPDGTWRLAWTSTALSNTVDQWGRWTGAAGRLVHIQHVAHVEDADFRADPDDEGTFEILIKEG